MEINKQLDPYDEIEITLHVIPLEFTGENISLAEPQFNFTCVEPDEIFQDDSVQKYEGIGTNMPDRIYVMNNRDFNLGVANHADKWAVFWLFTVCTFFIPRCL